jgi:hypothetical protein
MSNVLPEYRDLNNGTLVSCREYKTNVQVTFWILRRKERKTVDDAHPDFILKSFPHTHYYPIWHLVTWHPRGVFDDILADQIMDFAETEERIQEAPFNRSTDLSEITHINLSAGHVFQLAKRRHKASEPVKSAIWTDKVLTLSLAYVYETLMVPAAINVRVFDKRDAAADWLGVPAEILRQPKEPWQDPLLSESNCIARPR